MKFGYYNPEYWVIIKVEDINTKEVNFRILSAWPEGYLQGASWKVSSSILAIQWDRDKENYLVRTYSGSIYALPKEGQRMTGMLAEVYGKIKEVDNATMELVGLITLQLKLYGLIKCIVDFAAYNR